MIAFVLFLICLEQSDRKKKKRDTVTNRIQMALSYGNSQIYP